MAKINRTLVVLIALLAFGLSVEVYAQRNQTALRASTATVQQPPYNEYRGIRLGMTTTETRAKLGEPAVKDDEQDFYVFGDKESAQIAYDAAHQVKTISVDYFGGIGAPDYREVVGADIETRANGSLYKLVRFESQRVWVSYNRTAGPVVIVTVTIQKF